MGSAIITGASGRLGQAFLRSDCADALGSRPIGTTRSADGGALLQVEYTADGAGRVLEQVGEVDHVVHCAGVPAVFASLKDPATDHANNFEPYLFSLELARAAGAKLTLISSMEVIGGERREERIESAATDPPNPYGLSKLCCEQYTRMYHKLYGMEYVILRPSVFFGPGFRKGLMFDLLSGFSQRAETVDIFCATDSVLNFAHPREVVAAVEHLHRKGLANDIWNVGAAEDVQVSELIAWFGRRFGYEPEIRVVEANRQIKTAPVDKLRATGWQPIWPVWDWIEQYAGNEKIGG